MPNCCIVDHDKDLSHNHFERFDNLMALVGHVSVCELNVSNYINRPKTKLSLVGSQTSLDVVDNLWQDSLNLPRGLICICREDQTTRTINEDSGYHFSED